MNLKDKLLKAFRQNSDPLFDECMAMIDELEQRVRISMTEEQFRRFVRTTFDDGYLSARRDCQFHGTSYSRELNECAWAASTARPYMDQFIQLDLSKLAEEKIEERKAVSQ